MFGSPWKQAVAGVVLAAWFYFAGWVYSYYYFRFFHIDIFEIDMPLEFIVVQSTSPILFATRNYWGAFAAAVAPFLIIVWLIAYGPEAPMPARRRFLGRHRQKLDVVFGLAVAAILYFGGLSVAKIAANHQAREVWAADAPEIQFVFAAGEKDAITGSRLRAANDALDLRYLIATKDFYYVFIADKPQVRDYVPDGVVFKVRSDAVDSVWIRRRGGFINAP